VPQVWRSSILLLLVVISNEQWSQWSMAPLSHYSLEQFFFEKPVQLIDFTRTVHVNENNNFFKKN
jgi:hypothetical protein